MEEVSRSLRLFTDVFYASRPVWKYIGDVETAVYAGKTQNIPIHKPIYISGLARSGSTILLEMLSSFNEVASHQYKDFPFIFLPIFWSKYQKLICGAGLEKQERVHKDGLLINQESPEAMEEVLWMYFFKHIHDPAFHNVLDNTTTHPAFEKCYSEHIKKLLFLRGGSRYVAKANYNLARIEYILKLYPDAKFIIPVRQPVNHVFSLIKQHKHFSALHTKHPYISKHLKRAGHFEFGEGAVPVNMDNASTTAIIEALSKQDFVSAYANQWVDAYAFANSMQKKYPENVKLVSYEALCKNLDSTLLDIAAFCELEDSKSVFNKFEGTVKPPSYYTVDLSDEEVSLIKSITQPVAEELHF